MELLEFKRNLVVFLDAKATGYVNETAGTLLHSNLAPNHIISQPALKAPKPPYTILTRKGKLMNPSMVCIS